MTELDPEQRDVSLCVLPPVSTVPLWFVVFVLCAGVADLTRPGSARTARAPGGESSPNLQALTRWEKPATA
jgi:hypothetical protein